MQNLTIQRCRVIINHPFARIEDLVYVIEAGLELKGHKVNIDPPNPQNFVFDPFDEFKRQMQLLFNMYWKAARFIEEYARENNIK